MQSQGKRAFRFHPAFRECTRCLKIRPKADFPWHRDGWQYGRCFECRRLTEIKFPRTKLPWSNDDKTILTLAHARRWHPLKVAIRLNRTLLAVKTYAQSAGLGPWPCFAGERGVAATYAQRGMAQRKGFLEQTRANSGSSRPAPGGAD
jgi:hypothetical protein